jgi:hypothetical protein
MVDKEIDKVRAEFEAEVLASGGSPAGLQAAWAKGAGGVNSSNWRSGKHFWLHAVEYLNDLDFVESLRGGRRCETEQDERGSLDELRADGQCDGSPGERHAGVSQT